MTIINCKNCGGGVELSADKTFGTCECCGSTMTFPKVDDEQRAAAFNRGNHFRRIGEFDKALAVYERILREDEKDAEAHWCCALCRFGIEYVEDPATYEWLPTCHRASFDPFQEDVDYKADLEYSDGVTRRQYVKDAAKIAEVQRGVLATSQNTEPFDVFICYKESDENKQRTRDSLLAQDIYFQLTEQGRKVFFARITLEDVAGAQYEPYIFAALNSAKVMIVVGTKPEYLNAVWVKNEWSRFLAMMKKDRSKLLLPCYRDMDPYDLPEQLSVLQSYDMSKIGFIQDLTRGIAKVLDADKKPVQQETAAAPQSNTATQTNTAPLLRRVVLFLEEGNWDEAHKYCERVLDIDPECADAYLGKCCAKYHDADTHSIVHTLGEKLLENPDFKNALRFMGAAQSEKMTEEVNAAEQRLQEKRLAKVKAELEQKEAEFQKKAEKMAPHRERIQKAANIIAAGWWYTVALQPDGTVKAIGYNDKGQCNVDGWTDCIALSAWSNTTIALKSDGTVLATGNNASGQCDVSHWRDCVAVAAGGMHTVGLKSDGTVLAVGDNKYGQCDVSKWENCIAIAAGTSHTVGLKADGTVVATGNNKEGQCWVSLWKNCVAIAAGTAHTVGLKADGTVVATGRNDEGQLEVSKWKNCYAIAAGFYNTVALDYGDEAVVSNKHNTWGSRLRDWRGCVAVAAGYDHILAVKADGSVLVDRGNNHYQECAVYNWKLFNNIENIDQDRVEARKEAERRILRQAGRCTHCGGSFKGLFIKKCTNCGKQKDY